MIGLIYVHLVKFCGLEMFFSEQDLTSHNLWCRSEVVRMYHANYSHCIL